LLGLLNVVGNGVANVVEAVLQAVPQSLHRHHNGQGDETNHEGVLSGVGGFRVHDKALDKFHESISPFEMLLIACEGRDAIGEAVKAILEVKAEGLSARGNSQRDERDYQGKLSRIRGFVFPTESVN
jgi:hypothetical protein